jgi:hypothetical protein
MDIEKKIEMLQMMEAGLSQIVKLIFSLLQISWSKDLPPGFNLRGKINGPGDWPGYLCLQVLTVVKEAWEIV